ncbi:MAG: flagellar motor switch protein FliN [Ignavibacteria bacterium]|jgi:flagellar motor switch protein FliN/FliY|nr:flagellar motor switch protein FliN [Ignavibacteria bacterium]
MTQEEIDALISGTDDTALEETTDEDSAAEAADVEFTELPSNDQAGQQLDPKMDMLYDLSLPVSIELGRTNMLIRDVLKLGRGSVVEFDKLVSEPVDVLINGKKIAEGEVVVIDKHFGIRITTLVDATTASRARR